MVLATVIGLLAALCTMFAFLPQVFKVIKTRSAHDVSIGMLILQNIGVSLWVAYGVTRRDPVIIIANSVSVTILLILLGLYFKYGRNKREVA
jgi:MtN3 and saliva related transmembrane protein